MSQLSWGPYTSYLSHFRLPLTTQHVPSSHFWHLIPTYSSDLQMTNGSKVKTCYHGAISLMEIYGPQFIEGKKSIAGKLFVPGCTSD